MKTILLAALLYLIPMYQAVTTTLCILAKEPVPMHIT